VRISRYSTVLYCTVLENLLFVLSHYICRWQRCLELERKVGNRTEEEGLRGFKER
jgi:hypothetical protein